MIIYSCNKHTLFCHNLDSSFMWYINSWMHTNRMQRNFLIALLFRRVRAHYLMARYLGTGILILNKWYLMYGTCWRCLLYQNNSIPSNCSIIMFFFLIASFLSVHHHVHGMSIMFSLVIPYKWHDRNMLWGVQLILYSIRVLTFSMSYS